MKILIMIMMLILGSAANAQSQNQNPNKDELFSAQDNQKIVRAVDYICGDIWCEGYYDYKFISLSCDRNNHDCDLSFQFKESFDDQRIVMSPVQVCHIDGIHSLDQVLREDVGDEQYLKFEFINKLNDCFEELAQQYRGH